MSIVSKLRLSERPRQAVGLRREATVRARTAATPQQRLHRSTRCAIACNQPGIVWPRLGLFWMLLHPGIHSERILVCLDEAMRIRPNTECVKHVSLRSGAEPTTRQMTFEEHHLKPHPLTAFG